MQRKTLKLKQIKTGINKTPCSNEDKDQEDELIKDKGRTETTCTRKAGS